MRKALCGWNHTERAATLRLVSAGPHLARTIPWGALVAGCGVGLGISLAAYGLAHPFQEPVNVILITVRAGFVPLAAAVAFVATDPYRNLTPALPAPAWLSTAAHVVIALPALALTACVQFVLAAAQLKIDLRSQGLATEHLPWAALSGELTAWSAITLAAAAVVARTRWNDLGGAIAAPAALAFVAFLAVMPLHLFPASLTGSTSSVRAAWLRSGWSWWALGLLATVVTCWASRDPWSRLRSAPLRLGEARRSGSDSSHLTRQRGIERTRSPVAQPKGRLDEGPERSAIGKLKPDSRA